MSSRGSRALWCPCRRDAPLGHTLGDAPGTPRGCQAPGALRGCQLPSGASLSSVGGAANRKVLSQLGTSCSPAPERLSQQCLNSSPTCQEKELLNQHSLRKGSSRSCLPGRVSLCLHLWPPPFLPLPPSCLWPCSCQPCQNPKNPFCALTTPQTRQTLLQLLVSSERGCFCSKFP